MTTWVENLEINVWELMAVRIKSGKKSCLGKLLFVNFVFGATLLLSSIVVDSDG